MMKEKRLYLRLIRVALALALLSTVLPPALARQGYAAIPPPVTVGVGKSPVAMMINEVTNKIYTVNANDNSVTVIDGATNGVAATISAGSSPADIAIDKTHNVIYVANRGSNSITVMDGATNSVVTTIAVSESPKKLAFDSVRRILYVGHDQLVTLIDGAGNSVIRTVSLPGNDPSALVVNESTHKAYVATRISLVGKLTIIGDDFTATTIDFNERPTAIGVNQAANKIYVAVNEQFGQDYVHVLDGVTDAELATIPVGGEGPTAIAVNEQTNTIYVPLQGAAVLAVINGETNTLTTANLGAGSGPFAAAVNPDTNQIFVAHRSSSKMSVVDGDSLDVSSVDTSALMQVTIAVNPISQKVYLLQSNILNNYVSVFNPAGDTTPPAVAFDPNGSAVPSQTAETRVTVSDTESGLDSYQYAWSHRTDVTPPDSAFWSFANGQLVWLPDFYRPTLNGPYYLYIRARDKAGNEVLVRSEPFLVDSQAPTVTIAGYDGASPVTGHAINRPFTAAFAFSEPVDGFTADDIELSNSAISDFVQVNAQNYTALVTPTTSGQPVTIRIAANAVTDAAGNANPASDTFSILYDADEPTVTITGYDGASAVIGTYNRPFTAAFAFSEPVNGFTADDIELSNSAISDFTQIDAQNYTALVTPTTSGLPVTLRIAANAVTDAAGNANPASDTFSVLYDLTKPIVTITGFGANQILSSPLSAFSVTISEAVYLIAGSTPVTEADAAPLISMEKDGLPFVEYAASYDEPTLTYRITFDQPLEDGDYMVYIAGDVVRNKSHNTLDAVNVGFTIAVPAVTGLTADPTTLPSAGGSIDAIILGRHLIGQTVEVYIDGEKAATAHVTNAGQGEASIAIPANRSNRDKLHRLTVWLNGLEVTDLAATVTVRAVPPPPPPPILLNESVLKIDINGKRVDPNTFDPNQPFVEIEITTTGEPSIYVDIPSAVLGKWEKQNADLVIRIRSDYGEYRVPVDLTSLLPELSDWLLKNSLQLDDIAFRIRMTDLSEDAAIQAAFKDSVPDGQLLGPIVDFIIEVVNVRTGEPIQEDALFREFSDRIDRLLPMVSGKSTYWSAFRYNEATGRFEFVPAVAEQVGDAWFARIRSNTNSIYAIADNQVHFLDTLNHWSRPYVELAQAKGLVQGVGSGLYRPDQVVTRAEFAAMLVRALGRGGTLDSSGAVPYDDVQPSSWYYATTSAAKQLGLLSFIDGSRFLPDQPLTREEMAALLAAAVHLEQAPLPGMQASLDAYFDVGSLSAASLESVRLMVGLQIMIGTAQDAFSPEKPSTRAEAAVVLIRTLRALGLIDEEN